MKITINFELNDNAGRRTPEGFAIVDHQLPSSPLPDLGDFVCFEYWGKAYEFKVEKRQFNYLPNGELKLVIHLD
ncbi:hypothetical protein [Paraburkholderia xenovorans]